MTLAAETIDANSLDPKDTSANMADWFEVYYRSETANTPAAPVDRELSALEQMYAYY